MYCSRQSSHLLSARIRFLGKKEAPCMDKALLLELDVGFEPTTSWLRIRRSTGWANPASFSKPKRIVAHFPRPVNRKTNKNWLFFLKSLREKIQSVFIVCFLQQPKAFSAKADFRTFFPLEQFSAVSHTTPSDWLFCQPLCEMSRVLITKTY